MDEVLPELLTPDQVARWLGVTRRAVYAMVARGEFPAATYVHVSTRLRFFADQLRVWLDQQRDASRGKSRK